MSEVLKYLGSALRRTYDKVVGKPLPWSMIDKLESIDERAGQRADRSSPDPTRRADDAPSRSGPDTSRKS
jgi:hypothetical protein